MTDELYDTIGGDAEATEAPAKKARSKKGGAKKAAPKKPQYKYTDSPEEDPSFQVEENDDGRLKVSFKVPKRFVEWIETKAQMEQRLPEVVLEEIVRQAWAKDPMRRSQGGSLPASEFRTPGRR